MARPSKNAQIQDIRPYRNQIASHPYCEHLDFDEVEHFLSTLPESRFPSVAYSKRGTRPYVQPRGGFPLFDSQHQLTRELYKAGADFIPLTIDSYTRQNQYETATQLLLRSEDEEKNYLNGYPLVSHGYELTRMLYADIDRPISLRHGTPDARMLAELAIASGIVEIEGGGICYCLPYSEGFPIDRSLLYWQYVDRVCALYSTPDRPVHRESFGPLSATLVPPAITLAVQIIELLLAAEQGVLSYAVSFGQSGSIIQDLASAKVLRKLSHHYLSLFDFDSVTVRLVYHQWMGQFSPERDKAAALIAGAAIIANMINADKVVVKTVDEALGVPDIEANVQAVRTVNYVLDTFACPDLLASPQIEKEANLIESEVNSILHKIFDMSGNLFWESVFRAFQLGYLDIPFSPHKNNANKLITRRDINRSIRIEDRGQVPISDEDWETEKELLLKSSVEGRKTYQTMLSDINLMV